MIFKENLYSFWSKFDIKKPGIEFEKFMNKVLVDVENMKVETIINNKISLPFYVMVRLLYVAIFNVFFIFWAINFFP